MAGRRRLMYAISVLLALGTMLAGCGGKGAPGEADNASKAAAPGARKSPSQISLGAGNQGGAYYPVGVGIAEVISKNLSGTKVTPEVTGAATENVVLVGNGEVEMGITTAADLYKANKGVPPFDKAYKNVSVMFAGLKPGALQIVVLKDSPIKSISDLKGKKVGVGPQGGVGWQMFADILPHYGLKLEDIKASYISYQDSVDQLSDGNLDAAVIQAALPTPAITQLANTKAYRILSIENEKLDAHLKDRPYENRLTIPKGTYPGLDQDVTTLSSVNLVIVNDALSDELVYNMTKTVFDHLDQLHAVHASAKAINIDSATSFKGFRFHRGAVKFFKEKGKDVPAN